MLCARCIQISLLILIAAGVSRSQDSLSLIRRWLPLAVGDRWIYEYEGRGGDRRHPDVERLVQKDVAVERIPEGTLIRPAVRFLDRTGAPAWMRASRNPTCSCTASAFTIWAVTDGMMGGTSSAPSFGTSSNAVKPCPVSASHSVRARLGVIRIRARFVDHSRART